MRKVKLVVGAMLFISTIFLNAQDTNVYRLRLDLPLLDYPQNIESPYHVPSMAQSLEFSNDLYELSFWGIDGLGDKLFIPKNKAYSKKRKFLNKVFKYSVGLAFSKYGSELPVPLGVWGHEEFHRSVLAVNGIASKNGNWIFHRWDGTVYGISDSTLAELKSSRINDLLYSYVSGVQYEIALNERATMEDFYKQRSPAKNALLLYNAYYVFNYFRFSTSRFSDSVKVIAPAHENSNPEERDFAGADLTAWAYDMFSPALPYSSRDSFPNGEGVNRRIGFSELTPEAQDFLKKQKKLSLLNFVNPAIFFINRITVNENLSFNAFVQYSPTHFGNDIALFFPVKFKKYDLLINFHNYNNHTKSNFGMGVGLFNLNLSPKFQTDVKLNVWSQPASFYNSDFTFGGAIEARERYQVNKRFSAYISLVAKTKGWMITNPYLDQNVALRLGLTFSLAKAFTD